MNDDQRTWLVGFGLFFLFVLLFTMLCFSYNTQHNKMLWENGLCENATEHGGDMTTKCGEFR